MMGGTKFSDKFVKVAYSGDYNNVISDAMAGFECKQWCLPRGLSVPH